MTEVFLVRDAIDIILSYCSRETSTMLSFTCKNYSYIKKVSKYRILEEVVRDGDLSLVDWCLSYNCIFSGRESIISAQKNSITFMKELKNRGCPLLSDSVLRATEVGDIDLLSWLMVESEYSGEVNSVYKVAASTGQKDVISWMKTNTKFEYRNIMYDAVGFGDIKFIKWIRKNLLDHHDHQAYYLAMRMRRLDIIKLLDYGIKPPYEERSVEVFHYAVLSGNMDIIHHFSNYLTPCLYGDYDSVFLNAVKSRSLDVLKYIESNYESVSGRSRRVLIMKSIYILKHTIEYCTFEMYEWILTTHGGMEHVDLNDAIKGGSLEIVKDLLSKGHLIDDRSLTTAIYSKRSDIVKYLIDNLGVECKRFFFTTAMKTKDFDTIFAVWERSERRMINVKTKNLLEYRGKLLEWSLRNCKLECCEDIMKHLLNSTFDSELYLALHERGMIRKGEFVKNPTKDVKGVRWLDRYGYFTERERKKINTKLALSTGHKL